MLAELSLSYPFTLSGRIVLKLRTSYFAVTPNFGRGKGCVRRGGGWMTDLRNMIGGVKNWLNTL